MHVLPKYITVHNQYASFTSFSWQVDPNFLNGFLESSIESLRMSTDKEINGIINRDELIDRLVEKKIKIEKMLKVIMLAQSQLIWWPDFNGVNYVLSILEWKLW